MCPISHPGSDNLVYGESTPLQLVTSATPARFMRPCSTSSSLCSILENDNHCPAYRQLAARANQSGSQAGVMAVGPPTHGTSGAAPTHNQLNCDRMESQRRRWRFHTGAVISADSFRMNLTLVKKMDFYRPLLFSLLPPEMFNRLRPARFSRHFYGDTILLLLLFLPG